MNMYVVIAIGMLSLLSSVSFSQTSDAEVRRMMSIMRGDMNPEGKMDLTVESDSTRKYYFRTHGGAVWIELHTDSTFLYEVVDHLTRRYSVGIWSVTDSTLSMISFDSTSPQKAETVKRHHRRSDSFTYKAFDRKYLYKNGHIYLW